MKVHSLLIPFMSLALVAPAFAGTSGKGSTPVQPAPAPEATPPFTATIGYDTDYVFRGVEYAKNLISAQIDANLPLTKDLNIDLGAWYGASADDKAMAFAGGTSYGELDLYAALLYKIGPVTTGLKYTWYNYLGHAGTFVKDINELGITLSASAAGLDFTGGAYYDWTAKGYYFEVGASKTIAITDKVGITPGVLVSYANHYYGVSGFNHVKPYVSLPIKLSSSATLSPYIAGNLPIDSLKGLGEKSRVYGGIYLGVTF
jgi:Bacterial protein of unknown function (Gcw_chp)